jgi:hypothetical protein
MKHRSFVDDFSMRIGKCSERDRNLVELVILYCNREEVGNVLRKVAMHDLVRLSKLLKNEDALKFVEEIMKVREQNEAAKHAAKAEKKTQKAEEKAALKAAQKEQKKQEKAAKREQEKVEEQAAAQPGKKEKKVKVGTLFAGSADKKDKDKKEKKEKKEEKHKKKDKDKKKKEKKFFTAAQEEGKTAGSTRQKSPR